MSPSGHPEPLAARVLTLASLLLLGSAAAGQAVTSLGQDYLQDADLVVLGTVERVQPVGNGVVFVQIAPSEILQGGVVDPRGAVGVFLYASYGYEPSDRPYVFLLQRQGRGGRYRLLDSFPVEDEGLQRLAALREFLELEHLQLPIGERVQRAKQIHLTHLRSDHRWHRWNGVRELRWLLSRYPDSFEADDVEKLDAAVDSFAEPQLRRLGAALANRVRRALLLPVSPDRLALERLPVTAQPAPPELAELPTDLTDRRRAIIRPSESEPPPFDYGDSRLGPGGFATLVPDPEVHRERRRVPDAPGPPPLEEAADPAAPGEPATGIPPEPEPETADEATTPAQLPGVDLELFYDRYTQAAEPEQRAALLAGLRDVPPHALDRDTLGDILAVALEERHHLVLQEAIRAVIHTGLAPALPRLQDLVRDSTVSGSVRLEAIRGLGLLGDHSSLTLLESLADSTLLAHEALTAIRRLDSEEAFGALRRIHARHGGEDGRSRRVRSIVEYLLSEAFLEDEARRQRGEDRPR